MESLRRMNIERAILMADVSGSTPLYERFGDEEASRLVFQCIERMQAIATKRGGEFVRSKGDDVLCLFEDPDAAAQTARDILEQSESDTVSVHAGLHWGTVLWRGSELFGGALNIASRLSGHAKENEMLMSHAFTNRLSPAHASDLRKMGEITLRGTSEPTAVSSLMIENIGDRTFISPAAPVARVEKDKPVSVVHLECPGWSRSLNDGDEVTIGRSPECDLVVNMPWISRVHATIAVRGGLVEFRDQSAGGSTLSFGENSNYFLRRQTVNLNGEGSIELSGTQDGDVVAPIQFRIL